VESFIGRNIYFLPRNLNLIWKRVLLKRVYNLEVISKPTEMEMQGIFLWRIQNISVFSWWIDFPSFVQNAGSRSRITFAVSRLYSCIHATWLHCGHVWRATCRSTCSTFDVVKKGVGSLCGFRNSSRMLYQFFVASHGLKMLHFPNADSLFSRYGFLIDSSHALCFERRRYTILIRFHLFTKLRLR